MPASHTRRHKGQINYLNGLVAEDSVESVYTNGGATVADRRWRGASGEIDLIVRDGDNLIFVEVKRARTFDQAAYRLSRAQFARICAAATEYVAKEPRGMLTPMRFDLALVNERGETDILENITLH